jgi:hypothetical protein
LSASRRSALVQSMLARVLGALRAARNIDRIVVVTPDDHLRLPPGVEVLHDHRHRSQCGGQPRAAASSAASPGDAGRCCRCTAGHRRGDRSSGRAGARHLDVAVVP